MLDMPNRGAGRRRKDNSKPKGRQLDDAALADVRRLLGDRERRRDLLIEHLHLIQDEFGCLQAKHIRALAEEMRLSQVEVYEVASFVRSGGADVHSSGNPVRTDNPNITLARTRKHLLQGRSACHSPCEFLHIIVRVVPRRGVEHRDIGLIQHIAR